MAYTATSQTVSGELGGKHLQNHKLVPDTTAQPRQSTNQASSTDTTPKTLHTTEGRGDEQAATEEATDEDEEDEEIKKDLLQEDKGEELARHILEFLRAHPLG